MNVKQNARPPPLSLPLSIFLSLGADRGGGGWGGGLGRVGPMGEWHTRISIFRLPSTAACHCSNGLKFTMLTSCSMPDLRLPLISGVYLSRTRLPCSAHRPPRAPGARPLPGPLAALHPRPPPSNTLGPTPRSKAYATHRCSAPAIAVDTPANAGREPATAADERRHH